MKVTNIVSKTLCIYDRQVLAHTQGGMGGQKEDEGDEKDRGGLKKKAVCACMRVYIRS